jgi:gas vesicle protein
MSRHHRANGKSFALGAIFGGVVGGLTALLLAPKSGDKLRKDLSKKYQDVSEKTQDLFEDVCDQTDDLVEKAKDIAHTAKSAVSKICKRN